MTDSLFTRLASYSQNPKKRSIENFLTEVLAYLVNNDRVFMRKFVRHIIPGRVMQRGFNNAKALPQQAMERGIVDLVLTGSGGKVLVEVKIGAAETQTKIYGRGWVSQVQKYLNYKSGHVVYLTTRNVPSPDVKANARNFLGHFLLEELKGRLKRNRLSVTGQMLMDFMEENDMTTLNPFTKLDLKNAGHSFDFSKKCEETLDGVVRIIGPEFREIFHVRTGFTPGHFSPKHTCAYSYTRKFRYGAVKRVYIYIEPVEGDLTFGVSAEVPKKDMDKIKKHLKWEEYRSALYSGHVIKSSTQPATLAKLVLRDARTLRTALDHAYY